jgi:hypothetical protein
LCKLKHRKDNKNCIGESFFYEKKVRKTYFRVIQE